ncbi:hypothetical protein [Rheinheimera sp. 4Y26]|uniref:hypothetical protein n=1 Tax=Rheinheimera sp. 4Y26 TaxID=2977811 RepID=UPI0021B11B4B|nr:hypothetical protein [Rheinheimera sp. 4Y26]MCT6698253.1 hypothetical protein [Rheinheimera sp. 4Y26]
MQFWKLISAAALALALTACQSTPLQQVYTDPVPYNLTEPQLEQAILQAGAGRGWLMTPQGPGKIHAELNIRSHKVITSVTYNPQSFSITYVDSVNMDAKKGKIHRQYVNWVTNLRQDIRVRMNQLSLAK